MSSLNRRTFVASSATLALAGTRLAAAQGASPAATGPIWNSLAFVQEGRTYALGGDTWTYGGPRSLEVIVEHTLSAFLPE